MKTSEMFPSKFLKGGDLNGGTPTLTIASVSQEEVGSDRELKFVLYFEGQQKGVVLNRTNTDVLEMLYGDESNDWVGEKITLFATPVTFQGKTTNAIRFGAPKKSDKQKAAEVADTLNDEVPF